MARKQLQKPTPEQAKRMAAQDKLRAAVHEAGHAVVAASLGAFGQVRVTPNDSPQVGLGEYYWHGSFTRHPRLDMEVLDDGEFALKDIRPQRLDAFGEAVLGIAGVVAEHIAHERKEGRLVDSAGVALEVSEHLWIMGLDEISKSDSAPLDGRDDLEQVAEAAAQVLITQRLLHDHLTAELVEGEYLSDGQVEHFAREHWNGPPPDVWPPPVDLERLTRVSLAKRIERGDTEAVKILASLDKTEEQQPA